MPSVGSFFYDFCHRFSGAVTCFGFNPYQDRILSFLFFLQGGNKLERMRRNNAIIMITGGNRVAGYSTPSLILCKGE